MITRWLAWGAVFGALAALWTVAPPAAAEAPGPLLAQTASTGVEVDEAAEAALPRTEQLASSDELRRERRLRGLISGITIFVIAIFLGVELINRVPATLHTPLMSGSNAISGITVVGAIIAAGVTGRVAPFLGFVAVVLAMINVVGGFLVTHRMLLMFKRR